MDIIRARADGGFEVVGKQCDKCHRDWRAYRSLEQQFEMYEFTRVVVHAGYGAVHFADGDRLVGDLCQCCTSAILGKVLRKLGNEFEHEPTAAEQQSVEDAWFDLMHPPPAKPQIVH